MDKKTLLEYKGLGFEAEMLEEKIARLESQISSPKNQILSDLPGGGERPDMTDKVIKLIELKKFYTTKLNRAIELRTEIEDAIFNLESSNQRRLMSYRYIDGLEWIPICMKLGYEWAQVHRIHGEALRNMIHNDTPRYIDK